MQRAAAAIVCMVALLCAAPGRAAELEPTLAPSAALNCLTPSAEERAALAYPPDAWVRREGGTVSVELRFDGPDAAPRVRLLDKNESEALREAVRKHVRQFRVPCMKADDEPVVLRQNFVFVPTDDRKVLTTTPSDAAEERRAAQMRCLTRAGGAKVPEYPVVDQRNGMQGNLFVSVRFTSADAPPELQVLASDATGNMLDSVQKFVRGFRLPCLEDRELSMDMLFRFRMQDGARIRLKDMSLQSFIAAAKGAPQPVHFDLDAMGCPFELRVDYRRPHRANRVGELDGPVEARRPFLDWLSQITLGLPEKKNTAVLGDQFTLAVPCGKLDL